jgi:hypothetical protein
LRLLTRARQAFERAGIEVPAQSTPRQLAERLKQQADARMQRPALQAWLLRLEALRYAEDAPTSLDGPVTGTALAGRKMGVKNVRRSLRFRQQIATLKRELSSLLPLRTT